MSNIKIFVVSFIIGASIVRLSIWFNGTETQAASPTPPKTFLHEETVLGHEFVVSSNGTFEHDPTVCRHKNHNP